MGTKRIPIEEATEDQLRKFATDLGLEPHPAAKSLSIMGKIATVFSGSHITVEVPETDETAEEPVKQEPVEVVADGPAPSVAEVEEPWYTVVISETNDAAGQTPVPVCVNNRNMFILRNTESRIKHRYYHALMNAVQTIYEQPDGPTGEMIARKVLAYPVQTLASPSKAELDAWAKYKADKQAAEVAEKEAKRRFAA